MRSWISSGFLREEISSFKKGLIYGDKGTESGFVYWWFFTFFTMANHHQTTIWENMSFAVSKHQTSKSHVNHQIPTFTALLSCFFAKSGIFEFVTGKSSNNNLDLWLLGSSTRSMKWEAKNHKQKTLTGWRIWQFLGSNFLFKGTSSEGKEVYGNSHDGFENPPPDGVVFFSISIWGHTSPPWDKAFLRDY